jgi:hypothetical protein
MDTQESYHMPQRGSSTHWQAKEYFYALFIGALAGSGPRKCSPGLRGRARLLLFGYQIHEPGLYWTRIGGFARVQMRHNQATFYLRTIRTGDHEILQSIDHERVKWCREGGRFPATY